jgi:protein-ribulosamine 3-kinase
MTLPPQVESDLIDLVGPLERADPVGGGCISNAQKVVACGKPIFLKSNEDAPEGFFAAEAAGLNQLRAISSDLRFPEVVGFRDSADGWSWIALEWLDSVPAGKDFWARLGAGLARLHRAATSDQWGWDRHGFIGRLPQSNNRTRNWADFWWSDRLQPQLDRARRVSGIGAPQEWEALKAALPELLAAGNDDGPSLIHGDLWSGNVVQGVTPALVDPACYWGHREVDHAMADLFGGFGGDFFSEYNAVWPLSPDHEVRKLVYQLYYLLVHVNLFGAGYAAPTSRTLRAALKHSR